MGWKLRAGGIGRGVIVRHEVEADIHALGMAIAQLYTFLQQAKGHKSNSRSGRERVVAARVVERCHSDAGRDPGPPRASERLLPRRTCWLLSPFQPADENYLHWEHHA